jgi:predicted acyltransferase
MNRRLQSLDALRGIIIIYMVLVNCPGDEWLRYSILTHAVWDGWTISDLVAPGFLWVMGLSLPFALHRRMALSGKSREIFIYILRRSLIIFLIGMALNFILIYDSPDKWSIIEFTGILQRIGISYLIAAMLFVTTGIRGHMIWIIAGPLLYWVLATSISVPGFGTGRFDPEGNVASYIDFLLLGLHGGNYHSILSLLTTTATVSLGVLTGSLLRLELSSQKKLLWLLLFAIVLSLLGILAERWVPVNRRLWTPSFVLLTAGILNITFCVFYVFIDMLNFKKWAIPLVVFGLNPLFIFSFSEICRILANKKGVLLSGGHWISLWDYAYTMFFLRIANPLNASLLFSVTYVCIFLIIGYVMYFKHWIVKI